MADDKTNISSRIDHLYRYEYGKLVSVLTKTFGTSNIDLAEDVVQEAMLEALNAWTFVGVPDNPVGWIYKVAKNKALNILNKDKYKRKYESDAAHHLQSEGSTSSGPDHFFTDSEIADDQLRMIFTCCHSSISTDSQVALTLKTLCGFSIPEIAQAFLTTEENINKRLVRARKSVKDADIPFEVPVGKELEERLSSVLEAIYLLFNEGYTNTSSGDNLIQYELCEEAIRLAEIIASNSTIASSNTYALLALMSLNASRFRSRTDEFDNIIDLEHQDRGKWDRQLITKGLYYLEFATKKNEVSIYHILATISAQHCTAPTFQATDWKSILSLYDMLADIDPSPIILLNRAIVISKTSGIKDALLQLDKIKDHTALRAYLPYFTTRAELHFQNNEPEIATNLLNEALNLPIKKSHKSLINKRLKIYSKK